MKKEGKDIMVPDKRGNNVSLNKLLGTDLCQFQTLVMMNKMLGRKGSKKGQERIDHT